MSRAVRRASLPAQLLVNTQQKGRRKMFRLGGGQTSEDYCGFEVSESKNRFDYSVGYTKLLVRAESGWCHGVAANSGRMVNGPA